MGLDKTLCRYQNRCRHNDGVFILIRAATFSDAESIAVIYNHYILNTFITFEEIAISAADMTERIREVHAANLPWIVAEEAGQIAGYAYAGKWKTRSAYRYTVEISVYLAPDRHQNGLGSELYAELFTQMKTRGIHCVIGGIALPNAASIALHEKFGMSKIGHFNEVGFKRGQWIDVGYWQGLL